MANTLSPAPNLHPPETGSVDPSRLVDPEILEMGKWAVDVARFRAEEEVYNPGASDFCFRNLAGLFNARRVPVEDYEQLEAADRERLTTLAADVITFLHGDDSLRYIEKVFNLHQPWDQAEGEVEVIRSAYNDFQIQASIMQDVSENEVAMRAFTLRFGEVFASTFIALDAIGSRVTATPDEVDYFTRNIQNAAPEHLKRPELANSPASNFSYI